MCERQCPMPLSKSQRSASVVNHQLIQCSRSGPVLASTPPLCAPAHGRAMRGSRHAWVAPCVGRAMRGSHHAWVAPAHGRAMRGWSLQSRLAAKVEAVSCYPPFWAQAAPKLHKACTAVPSQQWGQEGGPTYSFLGPLVMPAVQGGGLTSIGPLGGGVGSRCQILYI